jgi:hypothetical protein
MLINYVQNYVKNYVISSGARSPEDRVSGATGDRVLT